MPTVSHSEVESYLLCRRKHYYGYTRSLQRLNESASLAAGSAGHKVLETYYRVILEAGDTRTKQKKAMPAALKAAREAFDELGYEHSDDRRWNLDFLLFDPEMGYFQHEALVSRGFLIKGVEQEFVLEYDPETEARLPFVVDILAEDPDRQLVVVDHKFVWDFYRASDADLQPQIPKYLGALRALNYKVAYGYYNMLRTRKVKAPTLEQLYDLMPVKPNGARVVTTFEEQINAASEIQKLKTLIPEEQSQLAFRVANKMVCQSCSFRSICEAELNGENTSLVLRSEYKTRERKAFSSVSLDADE